MRHVSSRSGVACCELLYACYLLTCRKHVATLPCNLSLIACFSDVNVSQGSYARCVGTFSVHLTINLPGNLPVNFFSKIG